MHPQLEVLLQIQDLKSQSRDLADSAAERLVEEKEFHVDVAQAVQDLARKVAEMEDELEPPIRARYHRISSGRGRAVVPVINGICYGCFVALPTALVSSLADNHEVCHCDNCGRFIYVLG